MKDLYPDAEDLAPPNMPLPRGKPVNINVFIEYDHTGNTVTRSMAAPPRQKPHRNPSCSGEGHAQP